ncbi:flagellar hook protein FlgE [Jatrophihabitans endophyticus]|uniref:Flagellar hook protein FlgE n=1 Tax=Jatrophihabitans endophyticus TaxID=1206085 RepID=A0A1M5IG22_9ACTN|nr:flagellar hook-basal body complex protein [Jatrophihabitans endophyticus]SHG27196.1 flagellar hook protein FlgE [Jatrophihabitans endophyticus]
MLRALYTGISGLNAHQQMLDVTANNIANVNTVGFKSSTTVFEDALSQTLSASGANSNQVGLGVTVTGTNLNFTQGSQQATGVASNMMIRGDGFFMLQSPSGQQTYTRNGAFTLDQSGHLVTADGSQVEGADGTVLDLSALQNGTYKSYTIDATGTVYGVNASGNTALGQVGLATFANPNGLTKIGDSQYAESNKSGAASTGVPGAGQFGDIASGYVEMSNVDLSKELTGLIVAQRGFQANSKVITTSDEVLQTLVNLKN